LSRIKCALYQQIQLSVKLKPKKTKEGSGTGQESFADVFLGAWTLAVVPLANRGRHFAALIRAAARGRVCAPVGVSVRARTASGRGPVPASGRSQIGQRNPEKVASASTYKKYFIAQKHEKLNLKKLKFD